MASRRPSRSGGSRRSSASRGRSSGGSRGRSSSSSNNQTAMIGGIAGLAVLVVVILMMGGEEDPKPQPPKPKAQPKAAAKVVDPPPKSSGPELKDPDRPAPAIDDALMAKVEARYQEAKKLSTEARKDLNSGDNTSFNRKIRKAWDLAESIGPDFLQPHLDWQEEADMEDWRVPSSFRRFEKFWSKLSRLRGGIKRVLPTAR